MSVGGRSGSIKRVWALTALISPTINGTNVGAGEVIPQSETAVLHHYTFTQAFAATDLAGVRFTIVDGIGSAYLSGAFRATVTLRLNP